MYYSFSSYKDSFEINSVKNQYKLFGKKPKDNLIRM